MTIMNNSETSLATLSDDLNAVKRDVAALMDHLKSGAKSGAQSAIDQVDGSAREFYRNAAKQSQKSANLISNQIEEQPLAALLIAVALGYVGGRLMSR